MRRPVCGLLPRVAKNASFIRKNSELPLHIPSLRRQSTAGAFYSGTIAGPPKEFALRLCRFSPEVRRRLSSETAPAERVCVPGIERRVLQAVLLSDPGSEERRLPASASSPGESGERELGEQKEPHALALLQRLSKKEILLVAERLAVCAVSAGSEGAQAAEVEAELRRETLRPTGARVRPSSLHATFQPLLPFSSALLSKFSFVWGDWRFDSDAGGADGGGLVSLRVSP